jgi:hypothetical protein
MISRDPNCVFIAENMGEAAVTANGLEHRGFSLQVMDQITHGGLDGLNYL